MKLSPLTQDLSIFNKLGFEHPPIGVKFSFFRPDGIEQLSMDKNLSLCEIFKEAQLTGTPFYFSAENNETCVGKVILGMNDMAPVGRSGQIGVRLGVFKEARNNYNLYKYVQKMEKGVVNYVAFSPVDKLSYDPDVLVITANPHQAEIVLRAVTYSTGEMYTSLTTPVLGCSWFLIYPFKTGKVNYLMPTLVHGLSGRKLYNDDTVIISIPHQWLPTVTNNLQEMKIELPSHIDKEHYYAEFEQILRDLEKESQNP
ncbi:MAG: DUF169 domain-containing protein [Peptococcaceae bacterium]|nr:DUF169 domain-containing protein [Peptococcaceae bacterium]